MWYKIEIIYMKKWKKKLYCSEFFYLNSNKKLLMWYKTWKKLRMFWNWFFFIREKGKGGKGREGGCHTGP